MDEILLISKKERRTRVWTTVDRNRGKVIAYHIGAGNKESATLYGKKYSITALRMWLQMEIILIVRYYQKGFIILSQKKKLA